MAEPIAEPVGIGRRAFLGALGGAAGLALTSGPGSWPRWLGERRYSSLSYNECLQRLDAGLSHGQRAIVIKPWDHPARQITNTVSIFKGPHLATLFDADQLALVERMYETMISQQGKRWLNNTITLEGKLEGCNFAIFSDEPAGSLARSGARAQSMITGGHFMLRKGHVGDTGYALGGPVSYGQQLGNGEFKVKGNAFAAHSDAANRFYQALDERERAVSRVATAPNELLVQAQGRAGVFSGVSLRAVSDASSEAAQELLETVLATYTEGDRADALTSIEANGGLNALSVSFYEDRGFYADGARYADLDPKERAARELPYWQVWRIEGPACVLHFKGSPHVHAYLNVVRDPARQNVGEVLTTAARIVEGGAMRQLMMNALRRETGEALAHCAEDPPGRICPGEVTTGVVYALDPFADRIVVATIAGAAMAPALRTSLQAQGARVSPDKLFRIATVEYLAEQADRFGTPERVDLQERSMRTVLTAYLKDRDLDRDLSGTQRG